MVDQTQNNGPQSGSGTQGDANGPEHKGSVGALLKATRERLGIDLAPLAETLRIRQIYLEAIEGGRYADLPGNAYAVGFIRSYAEQLGLDGNELARRFKKEIGVKSTVVPQKITAPEPVKTSSFPLMPVVLGLAIVAGAGYGGWYYMSSKEVDVSIPTIPASLNEKVSDKSLLDVLKDPKQSEAEKPEVKKPEPKKVEVKKPEVKKPEPKKVEVKKPEVKKPEPKKVEVKKPEVKKPEPKKVEVKKPEVKKPEPKKVEVKKPEPKKVEVKKPEVKKPEPKKVEVKKPEVKKPEPKKVEASKVEAKQPEVKTPEVKKVETPKAEVKKVVAPKPEAPKVETLADGKRVYGAENTGARVELIAKEDAWVQVTEGDNLLLTRVLRAGDKFKVPNRPGLKLMTGNAGGLQVTVDGQALPSLGEQGKVRRDVSLDPKSLQSKLGGSN